jgi:hypothetical protein
MKKSNVSVLFVFMLCVLIGYFEPANAAGTPEGAYLLVNGHNNTTQVNPNPLEVSAFKAYAKSAITSAYVQPLAGGEGGNCVVEGNAYFPVDVAIFPWFPLDDDLSTVPFPANLFDPTVKHGVYPANTKFGFDNFANAVVEGNAYFEPANALVVVRPNGSEISMPDFIHAVVEGNAYFEPANALQVKSQNDKVSFTDYVASIVSTMPGADKINTGDFSDFINAVVEGNAYFEPANALATFGGAYSSMIVLPSNVNEGPCLLTITCADGKTYQTTLALKK